MDSIIYYCFLCDAELNTSEEWNAHFNVSFFIFLLLKINFLHFQRFFKLMFILMYKLYSHIFYLDYVA